MAPTYRSSKGSSSSTGISKAQFVQMLNARREMKYNTQNNETTVPANGTINTMTQAIVVSDTADGRDGNQITVKTVDMNLSIALNASVNVDFVRLIVFADTQNNGVYPTVVNILTATDPNATYGREVTVTKRFRILHDKMFTLTTGGDNRAIFHHKKINLKNHTVTYSGTTSVETANAKGALFFLICGDEATNNSAYNMDWAVSYYDS
jgi:hypothetical protein